MIDAKPKLSQVLEEIRALSPHEQIDLLEQIAVLLRSALQSEPTHSILELEGLGAGIWRGIHAQDYVDQERDAWVG